MEYLDTFLLVVVVLFTGWLVIKTRTPRRIKVAATKNIICDSSALIDGRIVDVATSGFLSSSLIVSSSVLREMQYLADNSDHDKRARARHGLDVVKTLQQTPQVSVQILNDGLPSEGGVDERLVTLCKTHNADLLTLDFNLNKVASAEGITVLNINHLAQSLRMNYLPGEKRSLTLIQKGQDSSQAVGYLEDGTMVVVEKAGKFVGSQVEVEFTRALQTQAGKMLFAKMVNNHSNNNNSPESSQVTTPTFTQVNPRHTANKQFNPKNKNRSPEDSLVELANKQ